jgi:hypothetical protein
MKVNYSIPMLDTSFKRMQTSNVKHDDGSITPKTTTRKAVFDKVEVSPSSLAKYQKDMEEKTDKELLRLKKEQTLNDQKIEPLQKLAAMDQTYNKNLAQVQSDTKLLTDKILLTEKSTALGIKNNVGFGFETIYQENIGENNNSISGDLPAVLRYGLNTESPALIDIVGSYIEKATIHPFEEELFKLAFSYLGRVESTEKYLQQPEEYPNNIVLVDIFDRSKGFINEGNNQIHTVALWKKRDKEIVLIDPSNTNFSSEIAKTLKLKSITVPGNQIYFPGNDKTGYSAYNEIRPRPRDCIDIAVKIGFELNELQKQKIDIKEIEDKLINNIANTKAANKLVRALGLDQCYIRELQSSSSQIREAARKTIIEDGNFIKSMSKLDSLTQYKKVLEIVTKTNKELQPLGIQVCPIKTMPTGKINI